MKAFNSDIFMFGNIVMRGPFCVMFFLDNDGLCFKGIAG